MNANHTAWKAREAEISALAHEVDALGSKLDRSMSGGVESRHARQVPDGGRSVAVFDRDRSIHRGRESAQELPKAVTCGSSTLVTRADPKAKEAGVAPGPLTHYPKSEPNLVASNVFPRSVNLRAVTPFPNIEGLPACVQGTCAESVAVRLPDKGRAAANVAATVGLPAGANPAPSPDHFVGVTDMTAAGPLTPTDTCFGCIDGQQLVNGLHAKDGKLTGVCVAQSVPFTPQPAPMPGVAQR